MKKYLFLLFVLAGFSAAAQQVVVPHNVYFAGIHLQISESGRREIQKKVDALHQHPEYFRKKVEVADMYFPIIERVFREENLPDEFKFLALQESGLVSDAVSKSNAVGFWQFKQEAASDFGLKINQLVDERKHIIESTRGAAKYMHRSNNYYKNWFNTVLSYYLGYTGAKSVTRTSDIGATKMEVTDKTHEYQLTFLAHKIAFENFVGKSSSTPVVLQEHKAKGGQTLSEIALISKTDLSELERYNKWLAGGTVPNDKTYTVMIPVANPDQQALLAAKTNPINTVATVFTPEKPVSEQALFIDKNGIRAIVARKGDTKDKLAMQSGLSTRRFLNLNDMRTFDPIIEGEAYYVKPKKSKSETEYHVVQPGDRLISISQKYGVKLKSIIAFNRMKKNEALVPGRLLWLHQKRPATVPVEYRRLNNEPVKQEPVVNTPVKTATAAAKTETSKPSTADATATASRETTPVAAPKRRSGSNIFHKIGNLFKIEPKPERPLEVNTNSVIDLDEDEDEQVESINETEVSATTRAPQTAAEPVVPATTPAQQSATAARATTVVAGDPNAGEREFLIEEDEEETEQLNEVEEEDTEEATEAVRAEAQPVQLSEPVTTLPSTTKTEPAAAPARPVTPAPAKPADPKPVAVAKPAPSPAKATTHKVAKGETLYSIAKKYELQVEDLKKWNKLGSGALSIGQTLTLVAPAEEPAKAAVPADKPAAGAASPGAGTEQTHTVKAGETLYAISRQYNVPVEDLKTWNQLNDTPLPVGQVLRLNGPAASGVKEPAATTASAPAGAAVIHTVAAGESMYQISRKYNVTIKDIMDWNKKSDFDVKPGENLTVYPKASSN